MNERIEELAKQCYVKTGSPHTDHFEYWKFAELIVKECVDVVLDKDGKEWAGYVHVCREESADMIKKHFGVEE